MRKDKKERVIELRRQGLSYSEIKHVIPVAESSLVLWLKDVVLSKEQKERLCRKSDGGRLLGSKSLKAARIKKTKEIFDKARSEIGQIDKNDLWLIGTMLYWAEGSKQKEHDPSKEVRFSNSDPVMLKVFLKWPEECLHIDHKYIAFEIYIHKTYRKTKEELSKYWSEITGFPLDKLDTVYYKKNKVHSYRKNRGDSYHGVLRISVKKSTDLNRKITGWIYGVCERLSISDIIHEGS